MLVYFAIIFSVLLGFCGLALDTARIELRTTQLQAAADAGALAGAGELVHSPAAAWSLAADTDILAVETANGILYTGAGAAQFGSNYGLYKSDYSTIQVNITQSFPTMFMGLLTHGSLTVPLSVKATAQMPPCMWFSGNPGLNNGTAGFYNASAGLDAPAGCPIYSQTGVGIDYFAHVRGSQVRTSGPPTASGISGSTSVPAIYNAPIIPDPLAYVNAPAVSTCTNAAPIVQTKQLTGTVILLTPGTYCGKTSGTVTSPAIDIEGSYSGGPNQSLVNGGNCTGLPLVTLSPGLYVFVGGLKLYCTTVVGTGVTMYFTKNASVNFGVMSITSSLWQVTAPNDASLGGIPGIVLMNDRSWAGGNEDFQCVYSTWFGDGIVYLTGTGFDAYALAMSAPNYMNVVAANMYSYDNEIRPSNNYANLPAGNPMQGVVNLVQ